MRSVVLVLSVILLLLGASIGGAQDRPKPEIKDRSLLGIHAGQTASVIFYGENLAPKTVTVSKPPLTARIVGAAASQTDEEKKRGGTQMTVEVTAPANCPPDTYELSFVHDGDVKVTAPIVVVDDGLAEIPVKQPNATLVQAMRLAGPAVAVVGALGNDTPDVFSFEARAGETWEITLLAGRAGSPLDPIVRVRDRRRFPVALSAGDPKQDRRIVLRVPADGTCHVELTDAESRGGPGYLYRLTLRRKER